MVIRKAYSIIIPVPKPEIDLSFARYVAARKGDVAARSREGAAYAYGGDIKVRAALDRVRPVTLAVEAAVRLWQSMEKSRMLGTAVKVTGKQFPRIAKLADRCADTLRSSAADALTCRPTSDRSTRTTFGTAEDPYVVLNAALIDHLSETELLDVIGHECGHIQNNHVVYMTTLPLPDPRGEHVPALERAPGGAGAERLGPARGDHLRPGRPHLHGRSRRVDRLPGQAALGSHKLYSDVNLDEYLAQMDEAQKGIGRLDELSRTHPYLPKRVTGAAAVR